MLKISVLLLNFIWLDAASCADYLYLFFIGINVVFFKKSGKIYQTLYKILKVYIIFSNVFSRNQICGIVTLMAINLL